MEDCRYSSTQLLFQCVPGVDGTGCEADLLPQSSTKVRNAWSCVSDTLSVFYGEELLYPQGKLYLYPYCGL